MAKKKSSVADTKKNLQIKPPLSHKGFYTLLLTALLGMFIFVSYYASQQTQVYRSSATTCSRTAGQACGGGAGCCSGNLSCIGGICKSGTGGCTRTSGQQCGSGKGCCTGNLSCVNGICKSGGGGTCSRGLGQTCGSGKGCCTGNLTCGSNGTCQSGSGCTHQGQACGNNPGGPGCCPPNVCRNKNAQGVGTCLAPAGGGGGGGGSGSCTSITDKNTCNNKAGCKYFLTCNKCDSSSKGNLEVCGGGSPTPTPGNPCTAAGGVCRVLANGCAAGEVEDTSLACAGPNPANKICCQAGVSGTPTPTPGATGTATFDLSLSFQGITTTPLSGQTTMDVLVTLSGGALTSDVPSTGTFTVDSNGVWTGEVSFPNVPAGSGYKLLVKGPKHLQKKVCDSTPTETSPGTYHCGDGNITVSTSSTNTLDFSGIKLLVGDLPAQDGIVDSYDISLVRNGFCTTANPDICHDSTLLSQADLNLDGIIDSQDYSLLISSLSIKYDEQ